MILDFPDLKGYEKNTLYIIGNGFDLYHGVPSSYSDFAHWLHDGHDKHFALQMEEMFPELTTSVILWSDMEGVLNDYTPTDLYQRVHKPTNDIWEPEIWQKTPIQVKQVICKLRPLMQEWASTLKPQGFIKPLPLSKESRYLTFNFTRTLEDVYGIPDGQICHIHGSVDSYDEVIVGHIKNLKAESYDADSEQTTVERGLIEAMNVLYKSPEKQIDKHKTFFESLKDISRIVVLGHSLSDIDKKYFTQIIQSVMTDTHWHFSAHDLKALAVAQGFVERYQRIDVNQLHLKPFVDKMKRENCWIFNL